MFKFLKKHFGPVGAENPTPAEDISFEDAMKIATRPAAVEKPKQEKEFDPNYNLNINKIEIEGKTYYQVIKLWLYSVKGSYQYGAQYRISPPLKPEDVAEYLRQNVNKFADDEQDEAPKQELPEPIDSWEI